MADQIQMNLEEINLTGDELRVWEILRHHRGKGQAIKGRVLSGLTGINYDAVREIISHLASRHRKFIGSCGKGYFVPTTPEEHREANRSLKHRAMVILYRASQQENLSVEEVFHQARIDFENCTKKAS